MQSPAGRPTSGALVCSSAACSRSAPSCARRATPRRFGGRVDVEQRLVERRGEASRCRRQPRAARRAKCRRSSTARRDSTSSSACARALPTLRRELRGDALRRTPSPCSASMLRAHAPFVDGEIRRRVGQRLQRAVSGAEQPRPFGELGLPVAEAAFVLLRHRAEQRGDARAARVAQRRARSSPPPGCACAASPTSRRGRRPTVRRSRRPRPARARRQSRAILPSSRHSTPISQPSATQLVALRVPAPARRADRSASAMRARDHVGPPAPITAQRADRAAELQLQRRHAGRAQPAARRAPAARPMPRALKPKHDRRRRLHQRAAEHRRVAVRAAQREQRVDQARRGRDRAAPARAASTQHHRGVDHVLAGAAAVHRSRRRRRRTAATFSVSALTSGIARLPARAPALTSASTSKQLGLAGAAIASACASGITPPAACAPRQRGLEVEHAPAPAAGASNTALISGVDSEAVESATEALIRTLVAGFGRQAAGEHLVDALAVEVDDLEAPAVPLDRVGGVAAGGRAAA